ncbi:MAG: DUF72 domain-containing protein [Longimicrobiales bacterium]
MPRANLYIGISGWTYPGWRGGAFYPDGLAHRRELEYASHQLNTVEVNGTFYSLQRPSSFASWYEQTPADFRFALKGSRFITHMKQLNDVRTALANYFASGVLRLSEKLGPILWQFSSRRRFDPERFDAFMRQLPRTTRAAARLAREHDHRVKEGGWTRTIVDAPIRHAFEVRHESFFNDEFIELLRKHEMALVFSDAGAEWPYSEDVTSDFIYARLHGAEEIYASGYDDDALEQWARRIRSWAAGREPRHARRCAPRSRAGSGAREVYVFFDNDSKVRAPHDAMRLAEMLGLNWKERHA